MSHSMSKNLNYPFLLKSTEIKNATLKKLYTTIKNCSVKVQW